MRDVIANNATAMVFPALPAPTQPAPTQPAPTTPAPRAPVQTTTAPAPTGTLELKRVVVVDQPVQIEFVTALNPDCSVIGVAGVRTVDEPKHGKLTVEKGGGFTNFPQDNTRSACNRRRSAG